MNYAGIYYKKNDANVIKSFSIIEYTWEIFFNSIGNSKIYLI